MPRNDTIGPVPAPMTFKRSVSETLVPRIRVTPDATERKRYYAREPGDGMADSSTRLSGHEIAQDTPGPHSDTIGREGFNDVAGRKSR